MGKREQTFQVLEDLSLLSNNIAVMTLKQVREAARRSFETSRLTLDLALHAWGLPDSTGSKAAGLASEAE